MSVLIDVIIAIIALGIVVALIRLLFKIFQFVLGLAILGGVAFVAYKVCVFGWRYVGWWMIIVPIGVFLVLVILGLIAHAIQPPLEKNVASIFRTIEMGTANDVLNMLKYRPSDQQLLDVLNKYVQAGKLEVMEFPGQPTLYRWTEEREYPRGVVTHHVTMD